MLKEKSFIKMKTSGKIFKELFEHISSGVAVYEVRDDGNDFIFKDINKAGQRIDKIKKKDVIGKSVLKLFPEIKNFGVFDVFKRVYKTGRPEEHPISFYIDNRISGWRRNYVYKLPSGEIVSVFDDRTRQKQAEELLKISEEFSSSLMKNSPAPIMVLDADYSMRFMNPAFEKLIGYKLSSMIGKKPPYPWWEKEMRKKSDEILEEISKKRVYYYSTAFLTKDGKTRYLDITSTPIKKNGKLKYIMGIGTDVSERKRAEEELIDSRERLKKTLNGAINTLAAIVETKDPYTYGHQQRVCKLATNIAKELKLDNDIIEAIRIAALIHDIGKVNIPASILSKPGKLTDIEFEMIKTHPQLSYDMLKRIEFPLPIVDIILQHHEKLDGSGYPKGLKAKDIMLEAKILAVADVVEAMSSHRPYRPALGIDAAVEEIKKNKGILYDPAVVNKCVMIITKKGFKFD